jgi:hypothetical protein
MRLFIIASCAALGACMLPAQSPKTGAVPTGEPLAVVDDVKVWTTTYKEKVAETEYKDETGRVIGTGTVYQDKTAVHTMPIWYPVQGREQLSDEDFFKIAGDQKALDETEALRARGRSWNHGGMIAGGAGIVGIVAGYLVTYLAPSTNPVGTIMVYGGLLTTAAGYSAAAYGARMLNPETHAVDHSVAERAALQYNARLGKTVGLGWGKSF